MQNVVVDSSVIVKWFNDENEANVAQADKLLISTREGKTRLLAPEMAKYEFFNVLLKKKKVPYSDALTSISTIYALPVEFIAETFLLAQNAYFIADSSGITYYDATFLALAKEFNAILVTENTKHQGRYIDIDVCALKNYS